jgi:hypothetical protein
MEQDLYAAGYAAGLAVGIERGRRDKELWARDRINARKDEIRDILSEVSDFLDNYTDAEYVDGRPVGNRAMNLKSSIDELL